MATYYVDPNSAGGDGTTSDLSGATAAYASLTTAVAARNSASRAEDVIILCRSNGATKAVAGASCEGGGGSGKFIIRTDDSYAHAGVPRTDALYVNSNIAVRQANTVIERMDLVVNVNGAGAIAFSRYDGAGSIISRCLVKNSNAGGRGVMFYNGWTPTAAVYIDNCIAYECGLSGFEVPGGFDCASIFFRNCTAYGCSEGFSDGAGSSVSGRATFLNCLALANSTLDFNLGVNQDYTTITYCASDDATADNEGGAGNVINLTPSDIVVDASADNYKIKDATAAALIPGTSTGAPTDDILGNTRSGTWTIGAHQYVAAGSGAAIFNPYDEVII